MYYRIRKITHTCTFWASCAGFMPDNLRLQVIYIFVLLFHGLFFKTSKLLCPLPPSVCIHTVHMPSLHWTRCTNLFFSEQLKILLKDKENELSKGPLQTNNVLIKTFSTFPSKNNLWRRRGECWNGPAAGICAICARALVNSDLKIRRREARTATAAVEQDWGESRRARQKQKH